MENITELHVWYELPVWYSEPPLKKYKINNNPVNKGTLYLWDNKLIQNNSLRYNFYDSNYNIISGNIVTRMYENPYMEGTIENKNTIYVGIGENFINSKFIL
tara:strand:+ start:1856 stop:2161 length:306 start_codon:yes stop_codon:yes gene_type:complete